MRRFVLVPLLVGAALLTSSCAVVARRPLVREAHATTPAPFDVAFVGDSNVLRGASETITVLRGPREEELGASRDYIPSFFARAGMRLNPTWFAKELATPRFHPDAIALNLGINDTLSPELWQNYGTRIDKLMALFPPGVPVYFPTYPVALEPAARQVGANVVNRAWQAATRRWPQLQILRWGAHALNHPEWMDTSNPKPQQHVHYTHEGYDALARFTLNVVSRSR